MLLHYQTTGLAGKFPYIADFVARIPAAANSPLHSQIAQLLDMSPAWSLRIGKLFLTPSRPRFPSADSFRRLRGLCRRRRASIASPVRRASDSGTFRESIDGMTKCRRSLVFFLAGWLPLAGCASTAPPTPPATPAPPTSAQAGATTVVAVAPPAQPCCPHQTLWEFLGVKGLFKDLGSVVNCIRNELGSVFPGLEALPPMLAIADPKNLQSSNPAVAAAAGAKADEDQAAQKIKAIRYLATLGCAGCYPDVEDALLAALDDCTEAVRYEAVKALRDLSGRSCATCKTKSCCSPKVRKKLDEVANKMVNGCYKESSDRVRRLARLAMAGCGGGAPATPAPLEGPSEGPAPGQTAQKKPHMAGQPHPADGLADDDSAGGATLASATGDNAGATAAAISVLNNSAKSAQQAAPATAIQVQFPASGGGDDDCGCTIPQTITIPVIPSAGNVRPAASAAPNAAVSQPTAPPRNQTTQANQSASPAPAAPSVNAAAAVAPPVHSVSLATGGVIAEVNGQPVYEGEVLPEADRQLSEVGPGISIEDKMHMRPDYIRHELIRVIDRKLVCQEAWQAGPQVATASFNGADDEPTLATNWLQSAVQVDADISPAEMLAYYRANFAKYPQPAEVRFEQVTARFDRFSSREEALAAIEYARNRAMGVNSAPPKANLAVLEVQTFSWTHRDEIASPDVAAMLFRLPVGATSPVLDTGNAWRVVRALERHSAGTAPLELVSELVRRQILRERRAYLEEAYLRQLRGRARVWTVFDPQPRGQLTAARPEQELPPR